MTDSGRCTLSAADAGQTALMGGSGRPDRGREPRGDGPRAPRLRAALHACPRDRAHAGCPTGRRGTRQPSGRRSTHPLPRPGGSGPPCVRGGAGLAWPGSSVRRPVTSGVPRSRHGSWGGSRRSGGTGPPRRRFWPCSPVTRRSTRWHSPGSDSSWDPGEVVEAGLFPFIVGDLVKAALATATPPDGRGGSSGQPAAAPDHRGG